jgi:starch phosphorylase
MEERGLDFEVALMASRPGNLFTTHTSVEAGFDRFSPRLIEQYLSEYAQKELGIGVDKLLTMGRAPAGDGGAEEERLVSPDEPFNMAYLAIHGSGAVNAVSKLHGEVSRRLFQPLFPRRPEYEVPVGHVTNGVHIPSWDSAKADELWTKHCGKQRWLDGVEGLADGIRQASDEEIWELRQSSRRRLVADARIHVRQQGPIAGSLESLALDVNNVCQPDILTLGFARRFTGYKRVNLLLHDQDRLERLLCGEDSRVQLVFAGKAHPADTEGKAAIKQWTDFIRRCNVRQHALFLVDYDMDVAEHLVHGVDVWINTPRRPWEASGTSGMKILVNGGLNLSELDGWWAEGYSPEVGWALGDGLEHDSDPAWDAKEAEDLYNLIENVIIPEFYDRDEKGIPRKWVSRVRESMARLTPQYSANRMLEEYLEGSYLPATAALHRRMAFRTTAEGETIAAGYAVDLEAWRKTLEQHWDEMSFKKYSIEPAEAGEAGDSEATYSVQVEVELGGMPHGAVRVELFAEPVIPLPGEETHHKGELPLPEIYICSSEECGLEQDGSATRIYCAEFSTSRRPQDFTPRVVPHHPEARIPMEANYVLWFR